MNLLKDVLGRQNEIAEDILSTTSKKKKKGKTRNFWFLYPFLLIIRIIGVDRYGFSIDQLMNGEIELVTNNI